MHWFIESSGLLLFSSWDRGFNDSAPLQYVAARRTNIRNDRGKTAVDLASEWPGHERSGLRASSPYRWNHEYIYIYTHPNIHTLLHYMFWNVGSEMLKLCLVDLNSNSTKTPNSSESQDSNPQKLSTLEDRCFLTGFLWDFRPEISDLLGDRRTGAVQMETHWKFQSKPWQRKGTIFSSRDSRACYVWKWYHNDLRS